MSTITITNEELLQNLYNELKAEGARYPKQVIKNYLTYGRIVFLYTFEKVPMKIVYEGYSKVKSEVLRRNVRELAEAFERMTLIE